MLCSLSALFWSVITLKTWRFPFHVPYSANSPAFLFLFSSLLWLVQSVWVLNTSYFSALDLFNISYDKWVANRFKGIGLKISMTHPIIKLLAFYSDSVRQETSRTEKPCFFPSFSTVLWLRCEPPPESAHIMGARAYSRNACRCTVSTGSEKRKNGYERGFVRRLHCLSVSKYSCMIKYRSCIWVCRLLGDLWPGWCRSGLWSCLTCFALVESADTPVPTVCHFAKRSTSNDDSESVTFTFYRQLSFCITGFAFVFSLVDFEVFGKVQAMGTIDWLHNYSNFTRHGMTHSGESLSK